MYWALDFVFATGQIRDQTSQGTAEDNLNITDSQDKGIFNQIMEQSGLNQDRIVKTELGHDYQGRTARMLKIPFGAVIPALVAVAVFGLAVSEHNRIRLPLSEIILDDAFKIVSVHDRLPSWKKSGAMMYF